LRDLRVGYAGAGRGAAAIKTKVKYQSFCGSRDNVEEGRKILKDSGLNFVVCNTMQDAAEKVVAAAKGAA